MGGGGARVRRIVRVAVNQVVAHGFDDVSAVLSALGRELAGLFGGRGR